MSGSKRDADPSLLDEILVALRLPAIRGEWRMFAERSDREGWPAGYLIQVLMEHERAGREQRRIARHLAESHLIPGKSLEKFDFKSVPMVSKAQVTALATGEVWLAAGHNLLLFGPPGVGKSHLACGIGSALVDRGFRVLFARTADMVQRLRRAADSYGLEQELARLDRYQLLILDDFSYAAKDRDEAVVLFELIATRYERRSMLVTANQPFSEWDRVFPDQAMTLAAVDRLVHRATVLEMNVESYRRREKPAKPSARPAGGGKKSAPSPD